MIEAKRKSIIPVYGVTAVWVLYCLIFPLYKTWHFIALACIVVLTYTVLIRFFPDKVEQVEIPEEPECLDEEKTES